MTHKKTKLLFQTLLLSTLFCLVGLSSAQASFTINLDQSFPANVLVGNDVLTEGNVVADGDLNAYNVHADRRLTVQRDAIIHGGATIEQDLNVTGTANLDEVASRTIYTENFSTDTINTTGDVTVDGHVSSNSLSANTIQTNTNTTDLITVNRIRQPVATTVTSNSNILAPIIPQSEGLVVIQNTSNSNLVSSFQLPGSAERQVNDTLKLLCTAGLSANVSFAYTSQCRVIGSLYEDFVTDQGLQNYITVPFGTTLEFLALDAYNAGMAISPGTSTVWVLVKQ
ncbi:MAG: hypothetical protein KDK66_00075 [Deltaproteobacteria bacterium]|nr:hypothetical protein [Deltaproteobacteria bacterium]